MLARGSCDVDIHERTPVPSQISKSSIGLIDIRSHIGYLILLRTSHSSELCKIVGFSALLQLLYSVVVLERLLITALEALNNCLPPG
jgi:hypothetical protein